MALRIKWSCLWIFGLCLVASKSLQLPSITDPRFIQQCVESHNEFRSNVSPPSADMKYMSWDDGLAQVAEAWAKECKFEHNSCLKIPYQCSKRFEHVGENIWLGGFRDFNPKDAIRKWYKEYQLFDFDNLSCSDVCGHYTQIVWANSHKVGCAVTICPNFGGSTYAIFVCNYGPGGNIKNELPYTEGSPCSMCSKEERCVNKLCQHENMKPMGRAPQRTVYNLLSIGFVLLRTV
ncbi:PREDICTED: GLIPR1-like protein 1 isoform X2 [Chinchilla lanigera]|uniref:GLIPR1 like 1 n=1 Tax=Chinchilla lanigera TaxID=34839 RepID=A0A8C2V2W7_CHILA|nr:PREDICTED: GLIPR1-like protein 1 isoform X2 [Chinchilla lanigera]